nr:T9SS type A sorting domain-containing protein [Bacteroides intestinalis]
MGAGRSEAGNGSERAAVFYYNRVRVQNAEPGSQMEVYNIVGVKLTTIRIDSTDVTVQVNLPKGYYIFKIGNVVRKVVIK